MSSLPPAVPPIGAAFGRSSYAALRQGSGQASRRRESADTPPSVAGDNCHRPRQASDSICSSPALSSSPVIR